MFGGPNQHRAVVRVSHRCDRDLVSAVRWALEMAQTMADKRQKRAAEFIEPFRVRPGSKVTLGKDFDPSFKAGVKKKKDGVRNACPSRGWCESCATSSTHSLRERAMLAETR